MEQLFKLSTDLVKYICFLTNKKFTNDYEILYFIFQKMYEICDSEIYSISLPRKNTCYPHTQYRETHLVYDQDEQVIAKFEFSDRNSKGYYTPIMGRRKKQHTVSHYEKKKEREVKIKERGV